MRKSDALLVYAIRSQDMAGTVAPDIQFKIVDRFIGRITEIPSEDDSLVRFFDVLRQEIERAREDSTAF